MIVLQRGSAFTIVKHNKSENRNLCFYFLVAFAFSWLLWLPGVLSSNGLDLPSVYAATVLGAFGPFVAAFSLTYFNEGKDGVKRLLKRGFDHKFGKVWLIPLFLVFPAINGSALLLGILTEGATPDLFWLSNPLLIIVYFIYIFFLAGGVTEEFGWRGYALDRLQARYNAVVSSVILGFLWGLWHLPQFFISGLPAYEGVPFWGFLLESTFLTILFTWLYNNTGGSILVALIFHTMLNLSFLMFPVVWEFGFYSLPTLYSLILAFIIVIVVIIFWGPKRLVRETNK